MINRNKALSFFTGLLFFGLFLWGLQSTLQAAVIVQHPTDQKGIAGDSVLFTVVAGAENATYQWLKDGDEVPGATEPSYGIDAITEEDHGAWFLCRVTVDGESETSPAAQLVVFRKGDYDWDDDIDKDDVRLLQRNLGRHFVRQWFDWDWDFRKIKKKKGGDELPAELAEYDWNGDDRIDGRDLHLLQQQCTNPDCQVTLAEPPVIVGQPVSETLTEGDYGMFRVDAMGPELQYQWQKNGEDMPGATRIFLLLKRVQYEDDGSVYQCVITNNDGTAVSRPAILTVMRQADIDADGDIDVSDVEKVRRHLDRKWHSCPACDVNHDRKINLWDLRTVKEQCDVPNCEENNLAVPEIVRQPRNLSVVEKSPATFTVAAVGKDLIFQWLQDGNEIAGATRQSYTVNYPAVTDDGTIFQCRITSGAASAVTDEATLRVYRQGDFDWDGDIDVDDTRVVRKLLFRHGWENPEADFDGDWSITLKDLRHLIRLCTCPLCQQPEPPVITQEPEDTVVLEKTPATFTALADGIRPAYQWQVNGVDIPGATAASYTLAEAQLLDHGKLFTCIVTTAGGSVTSRAAELQVEMDVPENEVEITGLTVAWQRDKAAISWLPIEGMHYRIQRGKSPAATEPIGETAETAFLDGNAAYYFGWYYTLATIKEYFHPVSNKAYHAVGPLSEPVFLAAQPSPAIELDGAELQEDGSHLAYFLAGTKYTGRYRNFDDPVAVTVSGPAEVAASGAGGTFNFTPPAAGDWRIEITEPEGYRSANSKLLLKIDATAPRLLLHTVGELATTAAAVTLAGEAADKESGLFSVHVVSDQYGQTFGGSFEAGGAFRIEVPVKVGENRLTVVVKDKCGNQATGAVSVKATVPALPQLTIVSPANGSTVTGKTVSVAGTVRSSLPPEQIRLRLNGQVDFPSGSGGNYTFAFPGVPLHDGSNVLLVTAETPYGTVSAQSLVMVAKAEEPVRPEPPAVEMYSAKPDSYISGDTFQVSGTASGSADIVSVMVNGQAATITGSGSQVSFEANLDFAGEEQLEITQVITDSNGQTTTLNYTVHHDAGPPVLTLTGNLQEAPQVNTVRENPFPLQGRVSDANLAGFSVNDRTIGLLPAEEGAYRFDVGLDLTRGEERLFVLKAWDKAGNTTSRSVVLRLDSSLDIEIVSPRNGVELTGAADTLNLTITFRVPGLSNDDLLTVAVDGQTVSGLSRNDENVHGVVALNLPDGPHKLTITVTAADGTVRGQTATTFTVVDTRLLPLALIRQEPANNERGVVNNGFIALYFNKPVDPAKLTALVRETAHGLDYGKTPPGADMTAQSKVEMVEVHRDWELVPGGLSYFPAGTMAAFYPARNFAFGATVYVNIVYDGQELAATTFQVKPLPTFLQGFVADQFGDPIEGLTLTMPTLKRTAVSDKEGNFAFGFGDPADQVLPAGRYPVVANPGLTDRRFGATEFYASIESGRLNEIGLNTVPVLHNREPFRQLASGMAQAILAAGDLTLDLSQAALTFQDGGSSGEVHTQFLTVGEQPYSFINAAAPQWVFHLNPNGIDVSGDVGVRIKMPAMLGSYEYVKEIGARVVLVGLDGRSLQLVPVGVGRVDTVAKIVTNESPTSFTRLDIVGYGLVDPEKQPLLEQFSKGELTLSQLINALNN